MTALIRSRWLSVLALATLLLLPYSAAQATTIVQRDIREVADGAKLVVEGTVSEVRSEPALQGRAIVTTVSIAIAEVLKGSWSAPTITLQYLGGRHGGRSLVVGEMEIPGVGEHGIYFIRDPQQCFVHPLKGWEQGHFVVVKGERGGADTVRAANGEAVVELPSGPPPRAAAQSVGRRVASGLRTADAGEQRALEASAFRDWIRNR